MKHQHVQRIFKNPLYVNFKKHYCPECHSKLKKIKVSKIVNSSSPESEEFDFQSGETYMIGNVKFIWTEFQCPACGKKFSIDKMKSIERRQGENNYKK